MPQVDLDQDVYDYIKSQIQDFGETPSSVLRKLLRIQNAAPRPPVPPPNNGPRVVIDAPNHGTNRGTDDGTTAISRYLAILSELYKKLPDRFPRVEEVRGRKRIYFGKSAEVIEESGNSVMPEPIPGTPYYAATNLSDDKKKGILEEVLLKLGVGLVERMAYVKRLDPGHAGFVASEADHDRDDLI